MMGFAIYTDQEGSTFSISMLVLFCLFSHPASLFGFVPGSLLVS